MVTPEVIAKAKRRIKKFNETGEHQARTYPVADDDNIYEYKVRHHVLSIFFKRDKLGRLRLIKNGK